MLFLILLTILTIVLTAVLSSLLTLGLLRRWVERSLQHEVDTKVQQAIAQLGDVVEERVKRGVLEGVAAIPSTEVLKDTTKSVARTGAELVGEGLNILLGGSRKD